jgi:hypothetical protein
LSALVYGLAAAFVSVSGSLTAAEAVFIRAELPMPFRDRESSQSPRQQAARRLAEIEREIRHIKRLFPDLLNGSSRYRRPRLERGRDCRPNENRSTSRYLIH